ncbi:transporter family-2 protein [Nocardia transvalensis]|uniref:Transporter family-2 protein n=1 Tax=Nocardia transvalensis TaxID=37333 RepID=A0A7W9PF08_9NOCA|nr:DMT family transporter [Nocardia transvalensis]MBB5914796.1 transporter family-2 protein [Nocardia transvalensis]
MTAQATAATPARPSLRGRALALVFVFMLIGGALRSVEAGCQNSLKLALHNVFLCGVISYAVALTGVGLIFAVTLALSKNRRWPSRADLKAMPRWAPFGGLTGGAAIFAMIAVASSVGVSTFNALIIAGQMLLATVMDHYGVMGFPRRRITVQRLAGCALIIVGSYLMAKY